MDSPSGGSWRTKLKRILTRQPLIPQDDRTIRHSTVTEVDATTEDDGTTGHSTVTEVDAEESPMCKACQGIDFQSLTTQHMIPEMGLIKGYRWHATLKDWEVSKERCRSCDFAWCRDYMYSLSGITDTSEASSVSIWLCIEGVSIVRPVTGWDTHQADIGHGVAIAIVNRHAKRGVRQEFPFNVWRRHPELIWYTSEGDPAAVKTSLPIARNLEPTTASETSFAIAYKWLKDCLSHDSLLGFPSPNLLPLRLLEIGPDSCKVRKTALISQEILTSRQGMLQYATMSYCWGKVEAHKTTKANVDDREDSLDIILPATIRDAVVIARRLRVRYLWVDALCIVQDDPDEWRSEAAKMGNIYKNGLFNIAAGVGSDADAGCFSDGAHYGNARQRTRMIDQMPDQVRFVSRLQDGQESWVGWLRLCDKATKGFFEDVSRGPSADRAWVVQERLLSPRILHYTKRQLYWECQHCILAENGLHVASSHMPSTNIRSLVHHQRSLPQDERSHYQLSLSWYQHLIQSQYSRSRLTKRSDKLVALSGLARAFAARKPSRRYMAGLWENDLHMGLRWYRPKEGKKAEIYQAPSWSWASQDGQVTYTHNSGDSEYDMQIRFIAYNVQLAGQDAFGGIENASLMVEARLLADEACPWRLGSDEFLGSLQIPNSLGTETWVWFDSDLPDVDLDPDPLRTESVFCMPLELPRGDGSSRTNFHALLLQRTELASTYRRIGLACIIPRHKWNRQDIRQVFMQSPLQTITLV